MDEVEASYHNLFCDLPSFLLAEIISYLVSLANLQSVDEALSISQAKQRNWRKSICLSCSRKEWHSKHYLFSRLYTSREELLWATRVGIVENQSKVCLVANEREYRCNIPATREYFESTGIFHSSLLSYACYHNEIDVIQALLRRTDKYIEHFINKTNADGRTCIHRAIDSNQNEVAMLLIENGAFIDVKEKFLLSPLHAACIRGNKDLVMLLVNSGMNVNIEDMYGYTPLHYAIRYYDGPSIDQSNTEDFEPSLGIYDGNQIDDVIYFGDTGGENPHSNLGIEMIALLIVLGADVNAKARNGCSPINYKYFPHCDNSAAVKILYENGADIDSRKNDGETALLMASKTSSVQLVKALIECGADTNVSDNNGATALEHAIRYDNSKIVKLLLLHGADPNTLTVNNKATLLHDAIAHGANVDIIESLIKYGAYVNKRNQDGESPLHCLIEYHMSSYYEGYGNYKSASSSETFRTKLHLLISSGASTCMRDRFGRTPIFYFVMRAHAANDEGKPRLRRTYYIYHQSELTRDLRVILDVSADINEQDDNGMNLIQYACDFKSDNKFILKALIDVGADINCKAKDGKSLLYSALNCANNKAVILQLIEEGATVSPEDFNNHISDAGIPTNLFHLFHGNFENVKIVYEGLLCSDNYNAVSKCFSSTDEAEKAIRKFSTENFSSYHCSSSSLLDVEGCGIFLLQVYFILNQIHKTFGIDGLIACRKVNKVAKEVFEYAKFTLNDLNNEVENWKYSCIIKFLLGSICGGFAIMLLWRMISFNLILYLLSNIVFTSLVYNNFTDFINYSGLCYKQISRHALRQNVYDSDLEMYVRSEPLLVCMGQMSISFILFTGSLLSTIILHFYTYMVDLLNLNYRFVPVFKFTSTWIRFSILLAYIGIFLLYGFIQFTLNNMSQIPHSQKKSKWLIIAGLFLSFSLSAESLYKGSLDNWHDLYRIGLGWLTLSVCFRFRCKYVNKHL